MSLPTRLPGHVACGQCQKKIRRKASTCPHCGYVTDPKRLAKEFQKTRAEAKLRKGDKFRVVDHGDDGHFVGETEHDDGSVTQFTGKGLSEGQPLPPGAELATSTHLGNQEYRVDSVVSLGHEGPARTSSPAYRDGFDRIFGERKPDRTLN